MNRIKLIWVLIFIIGFSVRSTNLFQAVDTESWREADVSTIAKNFYHNGMDIFHPQIAWDGSGPGYTESEFQIYGYLIATFYKIFGFWEPAGRVISFLFSLATMIVFFRLCRYLLNKKEAIAASAFFAISPMLMVISVGIQPEATMFFFYVCSGYSFIRWLDNPSKKYYWLSVIFTMMALLCKITAANIGIFFLLLIIFRKGWRFLFNINVILFGVLSLLPSIIWYSYCHQFYVLYGNSLGISNEHSWIGWDNFIHIGIFKGLITNEILNIWMPSGLLIVILAFIFTKFFKKDGILLGIFWFLAASTFYIISIRTTSQIWAYYYHIFSIPAASILLGSAVVELYDKFAPNLNLWKKIVLSRAAVVKSRIIILLLIILVAGFGYSSFNYLTKTKSLEYQTSPFYTCRDSLLKIIPKNSLILASGFMDTSGAGFPLAYNISYFFYWLNLKGYNISIEDQSIKNVLEFKRKGAKYFLAEVRMLKYKPGFEEELKNKFKLVFECNGCLLFKI